MAKMKMRTQEKKVDWYDNFKPLKANNTWSIEYSTKSGRLELKDGDSVKFSDVSLQACKNVAAEKHSISVESWTSK